MFSDFFIKRPIFASVCSLLIVLAGAICIPILPISQYPQIAPTEVDVLANYIGANAKTVESGVTTPLETQINGAQGMKYMVSSSGNSGNSKIQVIFDMDRNEDIAQVDVQNRVQQALGRLPADVKTTGVTVQKTSTAIVMAAGFYSANNEYSNYYVSNYVDRYVKDVLKRVKGVSDVVIFGERKYAMRLWLNPQKMNFYQITATDIVKALQDKNIQVPAGEVGRPPQLPDQSIQMSVRVAGRLANAHEFDNMVLKTTASGGLIRVKDIGYSELGAEDYSSKLSFMGKEAVGIGVFQQASANALDVDKGVREALAKLAPQFPPGLKCTVAFDTTGVVQDAIKEVQKTLFQAILLVLLVIFVFLQKWRTTLVPLITIPVSLIGTFAFMKLFGFSINTLTLFGLTLATGLVVDDAIIVIENIERLVEEKGMPILEATHEGVREIFSALIATSLVLIAVFVPVAFFPGSTGVLYKQFALTIAVSIGLSVFNALTLTPALYYLLVKNQPHGNHNEDKAWIFQKFDVGINWLRGSFHRLLKGAVTMKPLVVGVFLGVLCLAFLLFKTVPMGFVPSDDQGYFIVAVQGPPGVSLNYTNRILQQVDGILLHQKEVLGTFSIAGYGFTGNNPNSAVVYVPMKPTDQRHGKEHSVKAVIERIRGALMGGITGALVIPFEPPAIQGFGNIGGFAFQVKNEAGYPLPEFADMVQGFIAKANQNPSLAGVYTAFTANDPLLDVNIDRDKVDSLNVNINDVFQTLQVFMGSIYVNDFDYLSRVYRVYAQAMPQFRNNPNNIGEYYVRSMAGQMIPLSTFVHVKRVTDAANIAHFNLFQSAEVDGSAKPGVSMGQAMDAMEGLAKSLPQGITYEWSGLALEQKASGGATLILFSLGFIVVYLILAAQYESLMDPFIIMLAVPIAIFGAMAFQFMRGLENDVFCQIALTMLIGLSAKNAILIVEFANQMRAQGMSIAEAAIHAVETRFRPIMMTSFAFILGLLPMALATGAGSAARNSMGNAVIGGMLVSTMLGLIIVPVLYMLLSTLRDRSRSHEHG